MWSKMVQEEYYYGVFTVPSVVFNAIKSDLCISGTTDTIKYLCANTRETIHLEALGMSPEMICDWYKVIDGGDHVE